MTDSSQLSDKQTPPASEIERLELQALEQRNEMHASVVELKSQVHQVRHDLDPAVNLRKHFLVASAGVSLVAFIFGYGFGGLLTNPRP